MAISPLDGPLQVRYQAKCLGVERIFEWDVEKNWSNSVKHGIRFEDAVLVFMGQPVAGEENLRGEELREIIYGEVLVFTSGMETVDEAESVVACVVYTRRNGRIRIISARRAKRSEQRYHDKERSKKE